MTQYRLRGGRTALGLEARSAEVRAFQKAAQIGFVTERDADRLSVLLGLTPVELWPDRYGENARTEVEVVEYERPVWIDRETWAEIADDLRRHFDELVDTMRAWPGGV